MLFKHFQRASLFGAVLLVFALCITDGGYGQNQIFSSGSTGAEGALNITAPGITYFNPTALNLSPAIPNIFNFTTIAIAAGSTLKFTEEIYHGPVFFLASGDVVISGTLDLSGNNGIGVTSGLQADRITNYAGSGGYAGGLGQGLSGGALASAGNGPGGGQPGTTGSGSSPVGRGGQFTGNTYLVPLIGGSGGGGAYSGGGCVGDEGGAGGGAILIASSTSITIGGQGVINATGGNGATGCEGGGGGSGGAIRLIAPTITGSSIDGNYGVNAQGGSTCCGGTQGGNGQTRIEAFKQGISFNVYGPLSTSVPYGLALPASPPGSLTVTSINGVSINANPFSFPDTTINSSGPVTVNIQAQYIPTGTVPQLIVFSSTGPDQTITGSPLQGTLKSSTSTATVTFPPNAGSRGFAKATWTQ